MSELRVVSVAIKDVLGAKEFKLAPGRITQLRGRNESGKTTALHAVQAALAGGSLAKIARVGKPGEEIEPEVVLVLDGPGAERYRVERTRDKVRVRARVGDTAAFEDVGQPQAWLSSLFDPRASNPVAFLMAKDADRALLLLEALPLKHDRAALLEAMGIRADELPPIMTGLHPLEEIGMIRDGVFSKRTGVNRDEKAAAQAADQLKRNIPAVLPENPAEEIAALDKAVATLAGELAAGEERAAAAEREAVEKAESAARSENDKIEAEFKVFARDERAAHAKRAAEWRAEVEKRIADDLATVQDAITERQAEDERRMRGHDAKAAAARRLAATTRVEADQALTAIRNTVEAKRQQLAVLREQARIAEKSRALADQAQEFENQQKRLKAESDRLTAALDALDAYRRRLAENLPIPGLEIEGKAIRVNGVPYEQLNTAQKVDIAVQVAVLRAKGQRLPVVFVDGAEALDREHFDLLVARLRAAGVQAFVARVEDTDLRVVTDENTVSA